jgi:hypothetical protein
VAAIKPSALDLFIIAAPSTLTLHIEKEKDLSRCILDANQTWSQSTR